jgi:ABC-type transport system involved in cytochrome c biogenesis permease component
LFERFISRERREGTLGLLFLTDLRGVDVALGKLTASSLSAIYGLLASFPVLGLCLLLGGVTGAEYSRVVGVLVVVLLTSLALGLLASTWVAEPVSAAVTALALIGGWQLGGPVVAGLSELVFKRFGWAWADLGVRLGEGKWLTPISALTGAGAGPYQAAPGAYGQALVFCALIGVAAVASASARLPRIWQHSDRKTGVNWTGWGRRGRDHSAAGMDAHRTRLLELHPVVWLASRPGVREWIPWLVLLGGGLLYTLLAMLSGAPEWWADELLLALSFPVNGLLKCGMALAAPRQFFDDRRSGAMELLLTTPVTIPGLVRGRLRALQRQFFGPTVAVAVVELFLGIRLFLAEAQAADFFVWPLLLTGHVALLFFDLVTIAWLGNWIGLSATGTRSTGPVIFRVLVLPWVLLLGGMSALAFAWRPTLFNQDHWVEALLVAWLGGSSLNNLFWLRRARVGLLGSFREIAAGPLRSRS